MSGHNEKRRMLDDEMSRFEAEISGPNSLESLAHARELRQIIGPNTFAQVKQQLKQASDDGSLQPPPVPPDFNGNRPIIRNNHPGPFNMPHPDDQREGRQMMGPQDCRPSGPGPFGPRPGNFNQGPPFRPNMNRPGPPNQGPPGPPFNHHMGPGGGPGPSAFPPPPPPPGFMGNHGGGGNNFSQNGMGPMAPPGFIPPQVNRANMNMGPMMNNGNNMGPPMGPHPPSNLLRPPPPPPGLVGQRAAGPLGPHKGMSPVTISKGPSIISSAPKLYSSQEAKDKNETDETKNSTQTGQNDQKKSNLEPKKKKLKIDKDKAKAAAEKKKAEASQALEMAEKVKQSMTTVKQALNTFHHQSHPHPHPQPHHPDEKRRERKPKRNLRYAGGQVWEDPCLAEWDPDDFRMFVGDLGNDVTDELLHRYFCHYASFVKAKVVRDKRTNKSKGYGFISFKDSQDYIRAMKEMNGKYLGSRPIKLRKSMWKDRNLDIVQKKLKEKQLLGLK